jgi:hypothetical protein
VSELIQKLRAFVRTRPGFEYGNYATWKDYRADVRRAGVQLSDAEAMLRACEWRGVEPVIENRLSIENGKIYYCAGQYYPIEYRAAVVRACLSAMWDYYRKDCETGDEVRTAMRREFGSAILKRYGYN